MKKRKYGMHKSTWLESYTIGELLKKQYVKIGLTSLTLVTVIYVVLHTYSPTDLDNQYDKYDYDFDTGWLHTFALPQRKLSHINTPNHANFKNLKHLKLHNISKDLPYNFYSDCIQTKTSPNFTICVYEAYEDRYISAALRNDGVWEPYITPLFEHALSNFPNTMVIDIGANIGYYTLLAASMGHNVVAVEPVLQNALHIHKAAKVNKLEHRITLLQNALFDRVINVTLTYSVDNQGGIWIRSWRGTQDKGETALYPHVQTTTLDHLLQVTTAKQAILKVDIGKTSFSHCNFT